MAALRLKENSTNGTLILQSPLAPRLGGLVVGLGWLGFFVFFLLSNLSNDHVDWINLGFVFVFVALPFASSVLGAMSTTTVTIDRTSRMLSSVRRFLFLPVSSTMVVFSDLANIEIQYMTVKSDAAKVWLVNAVSRDGKRVQLNWQGSQGEMTDLAQKVSALTGAPVSEAPYKLPTLLEQMLKRIAPEQYEELSQKYDNPPSTEASAESVASSPSAAPWTMPPNELAQPPAPAMPTLIAEPENAPSTSDVSSLSAVDLEKRVAGDSMDSDARYALARKYHARGQVDRAISLYQETVRLDPTNVNAQNDLGVALWARGKRAEAESAFRRAIALDPFLFPAHINLGLLLRALNRAVEASQEFFRARQNARGNAETRMAEAVSSGGKIDPLLSK